MDESNETTKPREEAKLEQGTPLSLMHFSALKLLFPSLSEMGMPFG